MVEASGTAALAPGHPNTKRLSTAGKTEAKPQNAQLLGVGKEVVSPGELCGFVDTLLNQLETRFEEMSEQVVTKMNAMSNRIDSLENAIQDLMHGDIDQPVKRGDER